MPERWGYSTDWRRPAADARDPAPPSGCTRSRTTSSSLPRSASPNGAAAPRIVPRRRSREAARRAAQSAGWDGRAPLVALAPGAAFGGAEALAAARVSRELAAALAATTVSRRSWSAAARTTARRPREVRARRAAAARVHRSRRPDRSADARGRARRPAARSSPNDSGAHAPGAPPLAVSVTASSARPTNAGARGPTRTTAARRADATRSGAGPACCASARSITRACAASRAVAVGPACVDAIRGQDAREAGAVFLDRDGTHHRRRRLSRSRSSASSSIRGRIDAIRALNRAGLAVVMVTNQSGVARGFFDEAFVDEVHRHIAARARSGRRAHRRVLLLSAPSRTAAVAAYARACDCRKPGARPDRSRRRAISASIPARSFVVGDRWLDVAARPCGRRAGDSGADRVRRGGRTPAAGRSDRRRRRGQSAAAASWILAQSAIRNPRSDQC